MVIVGCQFLIGVVFVAAVLGKVTGYPAFVDSVADMGFKPAAPIAAIGAAGLNPMSATEFTKAG